MNKTKKYKKKIKKYRSKKFSKKKFTKRNFSKKKFIKRKFTKRKLTKNNLIQKGGSDAFTDTVNIAQGIGGGLDLFNLAGSATQAILQMMGKKVAKKAAGEAQVKAGGDQGPEAKGENTSQAASCGGLQKLAKLSQSPYAQYGFAAIGAGAGLGVGLDKIFTNQSQQEKITTNYNTNTAATRQSQGAANDSANAESSTAKAAAEANKQNS